MADKLGVESIVLQVKGSPPPRRRAENAAEDAFGLPYDLSLPCRALGGIIATIRSSGISAAPTDRDDRES